MSATFTAENFEKLKSTCEKIIAISNENIEGQLMSIQLVCLGDNIKDFIKNPIVENSGILFEDKKCDHIDICRLMENGKCKINCEFQFQKVNNINRLK